MKTEILIASWSRDIFYLQWCIKSIERFARGFSGVTIVVPHCERHLFRDFTGKSTIATYERTVDSKKWQIQAQAQKCMADRYCPEADFILHMDSDCIFTEPVTPEDYFIDGKPVMLIEEFSRLPDSPWKKVTEEVLGEPVQYETMRRHPQVNPASLYRALRGHIEQVHKRTFQDFVLSRKADFPWGFSEHCAIGAFAFNRAAWRHQYHWIDLAKEPAPREKLRQFWSLSAIDKKQSSPHDHDEIVPLEICRQVIGE